MSYFLRVKKTNSVEEFIDEIIKYEQKLKDDAVEKLDMSKEFTGEVDMYGNPIYNGSIIALYGGWEGFWKVYKNEKGEWFKKSIKSEDETEMETEDEPLMYSMSHGEVIVNIKEYQSKNDY